MTLAFSVFLSLILLIELGAGIASYTFRQQVIHLFFIDITTYNIFGLLFLDLQVGSIIETNMEKGLQNYGKDTFKGVTETWNIVQHEVCKLFEL